jgi:hypothetical protein
MTTGTAIRIVWGRIVWRPTRLVAMLGTGVYLTVAGR